MAYHDGCLFEVTLYFNNNMLLPRMYVAASTVKVTISRHDTTAMICSHIICYINVFLDGLKHVCASCVLLLLLLLLSSNYHLFSCDVNAIVATAANTNKLCMLAGWMSVRLLGLFVCMLCC